MESVLLSYFHLYLIVYTDTWIKRMERLAVGKDNLCVLIILHAVTHVYCYLVYYLLSIFFQHN